MGDPFSSLVNFWLPHLSNGDGVQGSGEHQQ